MYRFASNDPLDCRDDVRMQGAVAGLRGQPRPADSPAPRDPPDPFGRPAPLASSGRLAARLTESAADVAAALALRHRVLAEEAGLVEVNDSGRDLDIFDPYCHHLIVRDQRSGRVVGTCRLLFPEAAGRVGSLFCDREFDLAALAGLRARLVEVGRLCIAPGYRDGMALMLLWRALCRITRRHGHRYLIGCCSLANDPDGSLGANLHRQLGRHHAVAALQVTPKRRRAAAQAPGPSSSALPALLRGYLLAGAVVLGEPFHDAAHRCSDLPLLVDLHAIPTRLGRRLNG